MFYAGIDLLFSILFPILFLVVLGMILWSDTTEVIDFLCLSVIPFVMSPTALPSSPMVETPALKEIFQKTQRGDHF